VKKAIVITTINKPTEAVEKFARLPDFELVIVGDKKTPRDWRCGNAVFLEVDGAQSAEFASSSVLPYNHYCRKMLGYLYAVQSGAEYIVDTDDDNIPNAGWSFPAFDESFEHLAGNQGFVNIYKYFTDMHIWPRGLPLRLINDKRTRADVLPPQGAKVGVWQGLADEDPDVDAIYRLTSDKPCHFDDRGPIVLDAQTITPFNSQNTMFRKELFPLLYLPARVTFRFTDILRSFVAQPIMWLYGYSLGFTKATVVQKRNPHDYFSDYLSEVPMYQHGEKAVEVVQASISANETISTNLHRAYAALKDKGIVPDEEMPILDCWLKDFSNLRP
jgi:hypothetical protein